MDLPNLSIGERVLLAHIAKDSRTINATLARLLGITERGVESMLRRLRERNFIEVYGKSRARQLFVLYHVEP